MTSQAPGLLNRKIALSTGAIAIVAIAPLRCCSGSRGVPSSPTRTQAAIALTVLPNPVQAVACNPACIAVNVATGLPSPFPSGRNPLLSFQWSFDNLDGTHDRVESVSVQFTDDRGNTISSTTQFNVI